MTVVSLIKQQDVIIIIEKRYTKEFKLVTGWKALTFQWYRMRIAEKLTAANPVVYDWM